MNRRPSGRFSFRRVIMKVKLLVPICGPNGSFKAGDEPRLPHALAKTLIKDGHAEAIKTVVPAEIIPEVEVITDKKPARKRR